MIARMIRGSPVVFSFLFFSVFQRMKDRQLLWVCNKNKLPTCFLWKNDWWAIAQASYAAIEKDFSGISCPKKCCGERTRHSLFCIPNDFELWREDVFLQQKWI